MKIQTDMRYKVEGHFIEGEVRRRDIPNGRISSYLYFYPNQQKLIGTMTPYISVPTIDHLIDELTRLRDFMESTEVANNLTEEE